MRVTVLILCALFFTFMLAFRFPVSCGMDLLIRYLRRFFRGNARYLFPFQSQVLAVRDGLPIFRFGWLSSVSRKERRANQKGAQRWIQDAAKSLPANKRTINHCTV
jgi:hypothetical protein